MLLRVARGSFDLLLKLFFRLDAPSSQTFESRVDLFIFSPCLRFRLRLPLGQYAPRCSSLTPSNLSDRDRPLQNQICKFSTMLDEGVISPWCFASKQF